MIFLPAIFSDHALFLHSAPLLISGKASANEPVTVKITQNGVTVSEACSVSLSSGRFEVNLTTPPASFTRYEITVTCAGESITITDILFGELWLACGQSNMQIENKTQEAHEELKAEVAKRNIRFMYFDLPTNDYDFPFDPIPTDQSIITGRWGDGNDDFLFHNVSAVATAFSLDLYDFLRANDDIPVGFACTCRGGSSIETWIERKNLTHPDIVNYFAEKNRTVTKENWNTFGESNYQQPGAYYNYMMQSIVGVKARGMLWYQGETNCGDEYKYLVYDKFMTALRDSYKATFGLNGDTFPIVSSLIYPWTYGRSGECQVGYLNDAFVRLMKQFPETYPAVPIGDLPLSWQFDDLNHPIHPTHKYTLGKRLASVVTSCVYGKKTAQPLPATLKSVKKTDGALILKFSGVGSGLFIKGARLKGIYIRSQKSVYTPAFAEILSKNTLKVYHPYVKNPAFVAYGISSAQPCVNLFAGDYPVCPFCTEFKPGKKEVFIQIKNFVDTSVDSEWICQEISDTHRIAFNRAVYKPCEGELCFDNDFSLSGRSLRVIGEKFAPLSFSVLSSPYHELDLNNYSALKVCLLNTKNLVATLTVKSDDKEIVVEGVKDKYIYGDWYEYSFSLDKIKKGCDKITFSFRFDGDNPSPCTVNLDNFILVPKN